MRIFDFLATGFILCLAVNLVIVFFLALLNGGEARIVINQFGEQWVEAVLFPVFIVMGVVTLIRLGNRISKNN